MADDSIYEVLLKDIGRIGAEEDINGVDAFLTDKVKVASMGDLEGFFRVGKDTLVHKAEKDLWRISESDKGEVFIERLFDPDTKEALRI